VLCLCVSVPLCLCASVLIFLALVTEAKVWFRVLDDTNQHTPIGGTTSVKLGAGANVDDLREAIKIKMAPDLDYCAAARLQVFPAGTTFGNEDQKMMKAGQTAPVDTSDESPLIVLAPVKETTNNGTPFCPLTPHYLLTPSHPPTTFHPCHLPHQDLPHFATIATTRPLPTLPHHQPTERIITRKEIATSLGQEPLAT
jgi:hypothetical protein